MIGGSRSMGLRSVPGDLDVLRRVAQDAERSTVDLDLVARLERERRVRHDPGAGHQQRAIGEVHRPAEIGDQLLERTSERAAVDVEPLNA
jgi:hypothetical protein